MLLESGVLGMLHAKAAEVSMETSKVNILALSVRCGIMNFNSVTFRKLVDLFLKSANSFILI